MKQFILASGSTIRAEMLRNAGVQLETVVARVDEGAIKQALQSEEAPARDIADALAEMKARRVAAKFPAALVLGADQVLVCNGEMFDKPHSIDSARKQLQALITTKTRAVYRHLSIQ